MTLGNRRKEGSGERSRNSKGLERELMNRVGEILQQRNNNQNHVHGPSRVGIFEKPGSRVRLGGNIARVLWSVL